MILLPFEIFGVSIRFEILFFLRILALHVTYEVLSYEVFSVYVPYELSLFEILYSEHFIYYQLTIEAILWVCLIGILLGRILKKIINNKNLLGR